MTDLLYSDVEEQLRAAVRRLLEDRAPWTAVLAGAEDTGGDLPGTLWAALAGGLGTAGLAVPEESGGAGASWREAAVVAEEVGRAVAPVPYVSSAVTATAALLTATGAEAGGLLEALAAGERTAALAVPVTAAVPPPETVTAGPAGRLTGRVTSVPAADVLLVPAGGALWAAATGDVNSTAVTVLDTTRPLLDVDLGSVPAVRVGDAAPAVAAALTAGAALTASEQLGVAGRCLEMTVEYVKTRHQFGRPVGSYQGLKHRLADLWVAVTQARAVARNAAATLADGDPDTAVAAAVAKAHCSRTAVRAAEECVQMHGGIGFTWEHPAHLYLKRAKTLSLTYGSPDRQETLLAALVNLPPA